MKSFSIFEILLFDWIFVDKVWRERKNQEKIRADSAPLTSWMVLVISISSYTKVYRILGLGQRF